jgi:hypothetical protein
MSELEDECRFLKVIIGIEDGVPPDSRNVTTVSTQFY